MISREPPESERYAEAVVGELQNWFDDLIKPSVATLAREVIQKHYIDHSPSFEFLLDHQGDWRLVNDGGTEGRVRLACYRLYPLGVDLMAETGINARLAEATKEFG